MNRYLDKNILKTLGFVEGIPEKEQEELLLRIHAVLFQRVMLEVLRILPKEKADLLEALLDQDAAMDEVGTFLKENVPSMEQIVFAEIERFKKEAKSVMG